MIKKKVNQHYVFQAYLKKWANESGNIWCLREGQLFDVKSKNIGFEKNFYRVLSLNDTELKLIKWLFKEESDVFKRQFNNFLEVYTSCDEFEKKTSVIRTIAPPFTRIKSAFDNMDSFIDIARSNMIEDAYCYYESEAIKWLNLLCDESVEFFYNPSGDQKEAFISFVWLQYFRTAKMKDTIMTILREIESEIVPEQLPLGSIRVDNICQPITLAIAAKCAAEFSQSHLTILLNKTDVPFITSDQPVIVVNGDYSEQIEFEFYYPVSPKIAVKLDNNSDKTTIELTDEEEVLRYNDLISIESYKMLFSNSSEVLKKYIK